MSALPDFIEFVYVAPPDLRHTFPNETDEAIDLLKKMLEYDPNKRITAAQALEHPYFHTKPAPIPYRRLPKRFATKPTAAAAPESAREPKTGEKRSRKTDVVPPADDTAPDSADPNFRPKLNESDRESLRKRKGALDAAFADAE